MKRYQLLFVLLSMFVISINANAQREIQFSYDDSGNMTNRIIYIPAETPKTIENSTDSDNSVDQNNEIDNADTTEVKKNEVFIDQLGNQDIKIYPNPTVGKLIVDIPAYKANSNDRIDIVNMQGILKQRISQLSSSNTIYMNSYPAATYVMIIHINGEAIQWKIVKQ